MENHNHKKLKQLADDIKKKRIISKSLKRTAEVFEKLNTDFQQKKKVQRLITMTEQIKHKDHSEWIQIKYCNNLNSHLIYFLNNISIILSFYLLIIQCLSFIYFLLADKFFCKASEDLSYGKCYPI